MLLKCCCIPNSFACQCSFTTGVLGDNWMLWLLPISGPSGDGLQWGIAEQKNADARAASSSTPVEEWLLKDQ